MAVLKAVAVALVVLLTPGTDTIRDHQQPLLRTLEAAKAWELTKGRGVTVAVVDSGVDPANPDLAGSVTTGPNQLADIDDDAPALRRHGTAMASIIAGHGHGGGGVIGIAPEARLLSIRAIAEKGDPGYVEYEVFDGEDSAIAGAIKYAVAQGVDVINLSLGQYGRDAETRKAVATALGRGVVVVASVGNDGDARKAGRSGFAPYAYPASYPGVIGVAATGPDHRRAGFSNRNYSALVAAPGTDIATAWPGGGYRLVSGTSPAAAVVSGVAALIRARHPRLAPSLVARALVAGVGHPAPGGYGPDVGYGEIDAARALRESDRLTGYTLDRTGAAAARRFGAAPGPVAVVSRPSWSLVALAVVALTGLAGLSVAAFLALRLRWTGR